jgi:ATP-dependent HslUV protease ATP-binding subunit HslU
MEPVSFDGPELSGKKLEIDADYVRDRVKDLLESTDLRKYIL